MAAPPASVRGRIQANSSPPMRLIASPRRAMPTSRRPTSISTWSPCWWPNRSLTLLKPSRSSITRLSGSPWRLARSASTSSRSSKVRRLPRPVSASVPARDARCVRASWVAAASDTRSAKGARRSPACRPTRVAEPVAARRPTRDRPPRWARRRARCRRHGPPAGGRCAGPRRSAPAGATRSPAMARRAEGGTTRARSPSPQSTTACSARSIQAACSAITAAAELRSGASVSPRIVVPRAVRSLRAGAPLPDGPSSSRGRPGERAHHHRRDATPLPSPHLSAARSLRHQRPDHHPCGERTARSERLGA